MKPYLLSCHQGDDHPRWDRNEVPAAGRFMRNVLISNCKDKLDVSAAVRIRPPLSKQRCLASASSIEAATEETPLKSGFV